MNLRPLAVPPARVSALAVAPSAQVCTLGRLAVEIQVRTSPSFLFPSSWNAADKINNEATRNFDGVDQSDNYNGTTSAMGEGTATPLSYQQKVSGTRSLLGRIGKAKGGDARGIPPRGRPV